jgi:CHASE3 domain sensor protein
MADLPRKYPHEHPDYSPENKTMPATLDDVLKAQQDTIAHLRKTEKEKAQAVTKEDLQNFGSRVVKEIGDMRTEMREEIADVREEVKGVRARVTILETTPEHHRARVPQQASVPPRSPEELGLVATESGTGWRVDDAAAMVRKWNEQKNQRVIAENQRIGAEKALEEARVETEKQKVAAQKAFDRKLRNWAVGAGLASLVFTSTIAVITYLLTHVSVH